MTNFELMGVINVTPDSFSDGSLHQSSHHLHNTLQHFKNYNVSILDIGAESSAPMNQAVGVVEETKRLKEYFWESDSLEEMLKFKLSLDSFRIETVETFIQKLGPQSKLIWNDVSGELDSACLQILERYPNLHYVYCHNEVKSRTNLFAHAKTFGEGDIIFRVLNDYSRVRDIFKKHVGLERLTFDPCLGFSKRYEENLEILKRLPEIALELGETPLMLGLSRKSFLRRQFPEITEREELNSACDSLQSTIFSEFLRDRTLANKKIIIRLHDPLSFELARRAQVFLK